MLSKPQAGWTEFSLGESCYGLSYLSNIPYEWLDRAIFGLEASLPFEVYGHCEPGKMVCAVDLSQCRIHYESGTRRKDPDSLEIIPISMLDFCKALHKDISEHRDAWVKWNASYGLTGEGLQAQLDRLQKLIRSKEK